MYCKYTPFYSAKHSYRQHLTLFKRVKYRCEYCEITITEKEYKDLQTMLKERNRLLKLLGEL